MDSTTESADSLAKKTSPERKGNRILIRTQDHETSKRHWSGRKSYTHIYCPNPILVYPILKANAQSRFERNCEYASTVPFSVP